MRIAPGGIAALSLLATVAVPPAHAATVTVAVSSNSFSPKTVTIVAGDTVTWQWALIGVPGQHSVTADDGSFDSHPRCGLSRPLDCGIPGVSTFSQTFTTPGVTVGYYCRVHGDPGGLGMAGTVVVT